MLRRLDETATQFANGMTMANKPGNAACSPQDVQTLRSIDLGSTYIQAAARVSGDTILCTSLGSDQRVSIGKPSLISSRGVAEYYHRTLFAGQLHPLNVFAAQGFAIIVDPGLVVDIPTEGPDVELAAYVPSAPDREPLARIGSDIRNQWFRPIPPGSEMTTLENGYLITRLRSARWDLAVIAATPAHYIYLRVGHFALILVPIGIVCGIVLSWAVGYVGRVRSSFPALIRSACKNNELYVEYQPIVDLNSHDVVGAEALVRWRSRFGEVRPDHFIPLAEEKGLIHLITRHVLSTVAADLPQMLKLNPSVPGFDQSFRRRFSSGDCNAQLDQLLANSGASSANVEIEATERAFLQEVETATLISQLRQKGFRVALDDFGTGYSSLSCLESLALDTLKIDRSFVDTIGTDGPTSQVILHIIEIAHSLKLELVAEGVETESQAQYLAKRGVRYAQGWLYGRPMPIDRLIIELEGRSVAIPSTLA